MTIYELTNKNRGNETIADLQSILTNLEKENTDIETLYEFKDCLNIIREYQLNSPNNQLNKLLKLKKITINQAIFITLGINPLSIETLNKYIKNKDVLLLDKLLHNNERYMMSMIAPFETEDKNDLSTEQWIQVRDFLNESINQKILESGNNSTLKNTTYKRQSTIENQVLINKHARKIQQKYPNIAKNKTAITNELIEIEEISKLGLKPETIYREYLGAHPDY